MDIEAYQEILERLKNLDDIEALEAMKKKNTSFKKFDDFLAEYQPSV